MYSVFQYVFGKSIFEIIKEGNLEELMIFLDQYPDKIESINSEGFTPLYCALVYNNNDISVELVRRGANIPVLNPGGALHWALDTNRQSIALVLVGKEQDINIIDGSYQTPLMKAVMRGWLNVVDRLLKRNADVTIQNQVGLTALMLAIEYGQIEIANRLIEHRDGLEASDQSGRTAIYYVIGHQNYLLLQKLISCGARINVSDENGWRPLHKASSEFFEEGVRLLLTEGADPNVTDENGWTALHLAAWKGYDTIVRCLLELCKLPSTLSLESESKDEGESPPIRRTPINMNKKTSDGSTPIMWALRGTSGQHKLIFDLLLEAGADLNIQNDEGSTVLHKAMQLGYATIATKLYLNGADPTIKNQDGHTPLDVAKDDKIRKLLEFTIEKNKILSQSI